VAQAFLPAGPPESFGQGMALAMPKQQLASTALTAEVTPRKRHLMNAAARK
jgi:hypothetical protein